MITRVDLTNSITGIDFSIFTEPQLDSLILTAEAVIVDYLGYDISKTAHVETGETLVDRTGRALIPTKVFPFVEITEVLISAFSTDIKLDINSLEIFPDASYFYVPTLNMRGLTNSISYKVSYTTSGEVPVLVKRAIILLCGNLVKDQISLNDTGISAGSDVSSFKSGAYEVRFNSSDKSLSNNDLSNNIIALLKSYKRSKQNSF